MSAFNALVRKDLRVFLSDRRSVIISFAVPLALASFMGFLTGGGNRDKGKIDVLVVDEDQSAVSREIVANLGADPVIALSPSELAPARERVMNGKVAVAVVVPKNFGAEAGRAFFGGARKPEVGLLSDPSHATELSMVRGILTQHVMQAVSKSAFSGSGSNVVGDLLKDLESDTTMPTSDRDALKDMLGSVDRFQHREQAEGGSAAMQGGLSVPFDTKVEALTKAGPNAKYDGYAHAFAGMGVQFVLFAAIEAAVGILTERQRGLWRRLRAAPLSRFTLLGAKVVSSAIIGALVMAVLFVFGAVVFHIHFDGSLPGFAALVLANAVMASCFGLLIAAVGKTPQAARGMSIFAVLVMVMLGGAWFPAFLFPPALQKVTLIMPTRWAVDGFDAMTWRGLGLESALPSIGALLGFAALFAALAVSRFKWDAS